MSIILNNNNNSNKICKSLIKYIKVANVEYLKTNKTDSISNILISRYDGKPTKEYINHLLNIGCIYLRDPIEKFNNKTIPIPKRITNDKVIEKGSILKYFFYPRVDSIDHIDTSSCLNFRNKYIIFENQYFLVVDKPHGLNLGPIVDHLHNNFTSIIKDILFINNNQGKEEKEEEIKFYNPHRLDSATRGLCIIVKDLEYLRKFNKLLVDGKIKKIYKAFIPKIQENDKEKVKLKVGKIYKHFMKQSKFAPKELFNQQDDKNSLQECLLKVLNFKEIDLSIPLNSKDVSIDLLKSNLNFNDIGLGNNRKRMKTLSFYMVEIELITGRTHQIRTQLSKLGYPILSDIMYNGKSFNHLLSSSSSSDKDQDQDIKKDDSLNYPKMIGLIACEISFKCPFTNENFNFKLNDNY